MRKAALALAALAIGVGGPVLAVTAAGGSDAPQRGEAPRALAWQGVPIDVEPEKGVGADEHILLGRLRNTSLRAAELDVEDVRVLDASGRELATSVRFLHNFAHGIYSQEMLFRGGPATAFERRRLGQLATVEPDGTVPITVSWRGRGAREIDLGGARVGIPAA